MSDSTTVEAAGREVTITHPDKVFDAHMGRLAAFKLLRASAKLAKRQRP